MAKPDKTDRYRDLDTMIQQGARSRYEKAVTALEDADELIPASAHEGKAEDLRQAQMRLQTAIVNLSELIAYRKMAGVD